MLKLLTQTPLSLSVVCDDQDFIVLDKAISPELSPLYNDLIQFPLVGQAQVMTYNIPELLPSDPNLIFDRTTLALIQVWADSLSPLGEC
jgi:hypothetical protein